MQPIRRDTMRLGIVAAAALASFTVAPAASAATLTFNLDTEFSGGQQPQGPTPWATATFNDTADPGGANSVRLTMSAINLVGVEFISQWYFNFDPALDPTALTITPVDVSDVGPTTVSTGVDAFQADGDGKFDILFDFPPPPGDFASKFTAGEIVVYDITFTGPIDVSSFDFDSAPGGGQGTFRTAAHVQGIGPNGEDSGFIGPGNGNGEVPEPATLSLFGLGLLGLGLLARRRRH